MSAIQRAWSRDLVTDKHRGWMVTEHAWTIETMERLRLVSDTKADSVHFDWHDTTFPDARVEYIHPDGRATRARRCRKHTSEPAAVPSCRDCTPKSLSGRGQNGLSFARWDDSVAAAWVVEGIGQHGGVASWAPAGINVLGMNGCRGIHGETARGPATDLRWVKGRDVMLSFDADWRTNPDVAKAARATAARLDEAGARSVQLADIPPDLVVGPTDGWDDVLARTPEVERTALLDKALSEAIDAPRPPSLGEGEFTDAVLAEKWADELLAGRFLWVAGLGWLAWDGRRWADVDESVPLETVRDHAYRVYARMLDAAASRPTDSGPLNLAKTFRGVLSAGRLRAILSLTKGVEGVHAGAAEMDADPDVLNTPSGVVDLRTGQLRPAQQGDRFRKVTRAAYRPGAEHADWTAALAALPDDAAEYLQTFLGQAATGHVNAEDQMLVVVGGGENGKTTVLTEGVARALGDYFTLVSDRMISGSTDNHPTELVDLLGARLAVLEETAEARRLDTQRLKRTVGTPVITARRIRQDSVTFPATHTMVVTTNHLPVVTETDHGTWRRLLSMRFPYRFAKPAEMPDPDDPFADADPLVRPGDPGLKYRVREDPEVQEAVLAWLVEGAVKWYAAGRRLPDPPASVVRDTRAWRRSADLVLGFLDSGRVLLDPGAEVGSQELLAAFNGWLQGEGHRPWSANTFAARMTEHPELRGKGVGPKRTKHARLWTGLSLVKGQFA